MSENVRLFQIFLWKNWREIRYSWMSLLLLLVGCSGILDVYLYSTNKMLTTPQTTYDRRDFHDLIADFPSNSVDRIFYGPSTYKTDSLMEAVREELQYKPEGVIPFANVSAMIQAMERDCDGNCYAINFLNYPMDVAQQKLQYSISSTIIRISPKKRYVNDEEVAGIKDDDDYIRSGFITLQHIIDKTFVSIQSGTKIKKFDFEIASMPMIAQETIDSQRIIWFGSLYSILFNVLLLSTFLVPLVEEKQNGIKEFLAIATPMNFLNGVSFFVMRLIIYAVFTMVVLIAGGLYHAFSEIVPIVYIILLFMLYILSAMSYTYFISVFFQSDREVRPSVLNINITDTSFTVITVYSILILQCLIYALLYNYLSFIFPGPGSFKRPYLLPFASLWKRNKPISEYTTSRIGTDAIIIQDLNKAFKKPKRIICDGLNMAIKNKEITVLLGHNGVGKTTTLNMIMGSEMQDSGKITVCGEHNVSSYRHLIGYCPQRSIFMPYMSCAEHLNFFAQVRGLRKKEACEITDELLMKLNLQDKENAYGNCLSGGMKRRLSLGIAIAGNTKVVILDEPSSGLDIESRRELWDILLKLRKVKAVLITTHHMEEAEVLGDTIAILANGRVHCSGSPLELKRKIGRGYVLKLCINNDQFENTILQIIQQDIPAAKILAIVPPAMHISLPYENKSDYSKVLQQLEHREKELGINSFSISDASLEDVFLNCLSEIDVVDGMGLDKESPSYIPFESNESYVDWMRQFKAIFYKKLIFVKNKWQYLVVMVLIPILSLVITLALMHSMALVTNEDKLILNLKHIQRGIILVGGSNMEVVNMLKQEIETYEGIRVELGNKGVGNVTDFLINLQYENLAYFLENYIGFIDVSNGENGDVKFNIYFSGNIYHSSVILMNLVDDTIARLGLGPSAGIETIYAPIRRYITDVSPTRLEYYAVIMPIGLFFSVFFYIALPFYENASGFKQLQAVPRSVFWLSTFAFDATLHFIICLLFAVLQILLMPNEFYSLSEQFLIIISIFFYGCSYLPILYILANTFRSISTISTYMLFMLIVSDKTEKSYPLLVHYLYKFYDRKPAVCGLSFVVKRQECFGLLGVNGAGKTSTFQMISANMTITGGTIKVDGIDIIENETEYRYHFGYCPQTDCLIESMTAYQALYYMAMLRGISNSSIVKNEVLYWLQQLDLRKYKDVQVRHYSGGTKRKLNTALAMIGSPSLVLLDEPTTGVDPESRRFLWKCIKDYQDRGKTVVLTSHSMDECEQLCNRLSIMAGGKFKCSGYVPDLKKRFGTGFTIKMKLKSDEDFVVDRVTEELMKIFPDCHLRENHAGIVTYCIKNLNEFLWSDILKKAYLFSSEWAQFVEDYSVNETTLEDIFLKFESNNKQTNVDQHSELNDLGP